MLLLSGTADGPEESAAQPAGNSTAARIARLSATVREHPRDVDARVSLADAYLQRARDLEDPATTTAPTPSSRRRSSWSPATPAR